MKVIKGIKSPIPLLTILLLKVFFSYYNLYEKY